MKGDDIEVIDTLLEAHRKATVDGDFSAYAKILRERNEILEDDDRELIAQKIEGSFKGKRGPRFRKNNLESKWTDAFDVFCCHLWLVEVEKIGIKRARYNLSKIFGVSETKIRERVKLILDLEKAVDSPDFLQSIRDAGLDEKIFNQELLIEILIGFVKAERLKIAEAQKSPDPKNHQNKPSELIRKDGGN